MDTKHAGAAAKLSTAITDLGGKQAIQEGRIFESKTTAKAGVREQLEGLVKQANRTAASIADEQGKPEVMDEFRMPHGSGDELVKTRAKAMAKAIGDLDLADEFEALGLPNFATTLTTTADGLQSSAANQGDALGGQVGATASIPGYIKAIKSAVKTLDAIYHNVFANDAETLGAWKSQSHVEKVAVKNPRQPTAPDGGASGGGTPK